MALVRKGTQQKGQVGDSIGERRRIKKDLKAQAAPQRPVAQKPIDKFAGVASGKDKAGLAGFDPNATFRQARRFFAKGTPHKRALHDHVEKGTLTAKKPPSDPVIMRFLDKVINGTHVHSKAAKPNATTPAGKPVQRTQRRVVQNPNAHTDKA